MKINCIIVDDEPLALELLESYVNKTPFLRLIAKCSSAFEALEVLDKEEVELLFLDIQMPELNGLELSRTLSRERKIIFTTAFEQYALEGFKVDALDYLLKPFNYEEFLKAANKAKQWFALLKEKTSSIKENEGNSIFVKSDYKIVKINLEDILYIEGLKDYAKFHLKDNDTPIITLMSMKSLEEKLPNNKFMRVHRSFIVSLNKIETIERNRIVFGKEYIPISDKYKEVFQKFINENFF